jgi:hypothetical protein
MKCRSGFVSNSSSSSFVMVGIKVPVKKLHELLGLEYEPSEELDTYTIQKELKDKFKCDFKIESCDNFFNRDDKSHEVVIGKSHCTIDDGCVCDITPSEEFKDSVAQEIDRLDICDNPVTAKDLSIYVQYISNDNF